jgi:hypothetical protein
LLEPFAARIDSRDWWRNARRHLHEFQLRGVPPPVHCRSRPGAATLADAAISADDWVVVKTTRSSLRLLDAAWKWADTDWLPSRDWRILLAEDTPAGSALVAYNAELTPFARCEFDPHGEFRTRGGLEIPAAGLAVRSLRSTNASVIVVPPDLG